MTDDRIKLIQQWCPECHGTGMEFDCPNIELHKLLDRLEEPDELLSRRQTATRLGISLKILAKLTDANLIPYQVVDKAYVFRSRDVDGLWDNLKALGRG